MKKYTSILFVLLAMALLGACGGPKGGNPDAKRQAVRDMAQETLGKLGMFRT